MTTTPPCDIACGHDNFWPVKEEREGGETSETIPFLPLLPLILEEKKLCSPSLGLRIAMHPPGGLRIEEKKSFSSSSSSYYHQHQQHHTKVVDAAPPPNRSNAETMAISPELRNNSSSHHHPAASSVSYQSTPSSRSSVLERAREYNRRIQTQTENRRRNDTDTASNRRAKSLERGTAAAAAAGGFSVYGDGHHNNIGNDDNRSAATASSATGSSFPYGVGSSSGPPRRRSRSAGAHSSASGGGSGVLGGGNRMSTRERALASVRRDMHQTSSSQSLQKKNNNAQLEDPFAPMNSPTASAYTASSSSSRSTPQPHQQQQHQPTANASKPRQHQPSQQQQQPQPSARGARAVNVNPNAGAPHLHSSAATAKTTNTSSTKSHHHPTPPPPARNPNAAQQPHHTHHPRQQQQQQPPAPPQSQPAVLPSSSSSRDPIPSRTTQSPPNNNGAGGNGDGADPAAVVTPELLVDALSGHEDGLLAIAERLMEHYDRGYDVMGEAIIDAFADVQKLFQHVVEAAHMEGAAFEASRRDEEDQHTHRHHRGVGGADANRDLLLDLPADPVAGSPANGGAAGSPAGPARHDEFIDQDVQDVLTEAIRRGSLLRDANKHTECYELYDRACQAASSLLPVDSDHRGRLQLSLARADSMAADRACAILRYAMDDVLRSGLRAARTPLPDVSRRADVVLTRPGSHPSTFGPAAVVQSPDEALQSLVDELQELLSAPLYADQPSAAPLQTAAKRFWIALADARKAQKKNADRLEQQLGKLKGDYLLAKAVRNNKSMTVAL